MRPHLNAVTLAVEDLERSLAFYRDGLGMPTTGIIGTEFPGDETNPGGATVMFTLDDATVSGVAPGR
jgi:uncharacterized protein